MTTLSGRKYEISRVVVTILITNADNATMRQGDPHYTGLVMMDRNVRDEIMVALLPLKGTTWFSIQAHYH